MEIREKSNIKLYLASQEDEYYLLSNCSIFDYGNPNPDIEPDGYTYILPRKKACFEFKLQDQELLVFVEKVEQQRRYVWVSQTHWLFMRYVIEKRLNLDVKILKRYPGKLTVAQLRMPGQIIDRNALKSLSAEMKEKIYIKSAK